MMKTSMRQRVLSVFLACSMLATSPGSILGEDSAVLLSQESTEAVVLSQAGETAESTDSGSGGGQDTGTVSEPATASEPAASAGTDAGGGASETPSGTVSEASGGTVAETPAVIETPAQESPDSAQDTATSDPSSSGDPAASQETGADQSSAAADSTAADQGTVSGTVPAASDAAAGGQSASAGASSSDTNRTQNSSSTANSTTNTPSIEDTLNEGTDTSTTSDTGTVSAPDLSGYAENGTIDDETASLPGMDDQITHETTTVGTATDPEQIKGRTLNVQVSSQAQFSHDTVQTGELEAVNQLWQWMFGRNAETAKNQSTDISLEIKGELPEDVTAQAGSILFDEEDIYSETAVVAIDVLFTRKDGTEYIPTSPLRVTVSGSAIGNVMSEGSPYFLIYAHDEYNAMENLIVDEVDLTSDVTVFRELPQNESEAKNDYWTERSSRLQYDLGDDTERVTFYEDSDELSMNRSGQMVRFVFPGNAPLRFVISAQRPERTIQASSGDAAGSNYVQATVTGYLSVGTTLTAQSLDTAGYAETLGSDVYLAADLALNHINNDGQSETYQPDRSVKVTLSGGRIAQAAAEGIPLGVWNLTDPARPVIVDNVQPAGDGVSFETQSIGLFVVVPEGGSLLTPADGLVEDSADQTGEAEIIADLADGTDGQGADGQAADGLTSDGQTTDGQTADGMGGLVSEGQNGDLSSANQDQNGGMTMVIRPRMMTMR